MKPKFNRLSASFWGYAAVIMAIVAPWFMKPGYLFFTDNVWGPNIRLDWTSAWYLFNLLAKGLSFIFPIAFLEKLFITAILLLILLGGRLLIKSVLKLIKVDSEEKSSSGLIFILSLFVLFNPFVYDRMLYGQFSVLISYGAILFVFANLLNVWQSLGQRCLLQLAVSSALVLMFSVHFIFFLAFFYLIFFISLYLKYQESKELLFWRIFLRTIIFSVLIVIIININWLIAGFTSLSPNFRLLKEGISHTDLIAFQTAGDTPSQTIINVLLMSGFWGKEQFRYFDLTDAPDWRRSFIFLTPLIIYGVWLSFRHRPRSEKILSAGLLVIFFLAVVLAVGIKVPIARDLTLFLDDHLPLYRSLREPQKLVAVIIPIYLFYLTLGARRLTKTKIIINNQAISGLILTSIIIMAAPSLLWGFNRQVRSTPYPQDWYEANKFLLSRSGESPYCSDKIIFLPWHMYMSFHWVGKIIANPTTVFFSCPVISGTNMEWGGIYDNSQDFDGRIISTWLADSGQKGAPKIQGSAARYIILTKEVDWLHYSWLSNLPYLKLIKETETLFVYEIKS